MKRVVHIVLVVVALSAWSCRDVSTTTDPKVVNTTTFNYVVFEGGNTDAGATVISSSLGFSVGIRDTDAVRMALVPHASISGPDASMFTFDTSTHFPFQLSPHGLAWLKIIFTPTKLGKATATLSVTVTTTEGTYTSTNTLSGTGTSNEGPSYSIARTRIDFGPLQPEMLRSNNSVAQSIVVTNTGSIPLVFKKLDSTGLFIGNPNYRVEIPGAMDLSPGFRYELMPLNSMTIRVTFAPKALGPQSGSLLLSDSGLTKHFVIPLTGSCATDGYPLMDTLTLRMDRSVATSLDTTIWLKNRFGFPMVLNGVDCPNINAIIPRVNYTVFPATIAVGDSLPFEFLWTGGPVGQLQFTFSDFSQRAVMPVVTN